MLDKTGLKFFEAIDSDVKLFGDVTFELSSGNGDHDFFGIIKNNTKKSQLQIKRNVEETTYTVSFLNDFPLFSINFFIFRYH